MGFAVLLALQWVGAVPIAGASDHRVTICHIPPGNPDNAHTITVGAPAVSAHLDHGDTIGACRTEVPTATPTSGNPIATPTPVEFIPGTTPCVEDEVFNEVTGECIHIDQIETETSSTQVAPVKLPVTGGVEGDLASSGNAWAAWLLVAGFLSTGMSFVMRIRS